MIFKKFIDLLSESYTKTNFLPEEKDKKIIYVHPEMMELYENYTSFQFIKDHVSTDFEDIFRKMSEELKELEIFIGISSSYRYFDPLKNELMMFSILDRTDVSHYVLYEITRFIRYEDSYNIHFLQYSDNRQNFRDQLKFYKKKLEESNKPKPEFKKFFRSYWYYDEFTVVGLTNLNSANKTAIDIRISEHYPFSPLEKKVQEVLNDLIQKKIINDEFIYMEKMCKNNNI